MGERTRQQGDKRRFSVQEALSPSTGARKDHRPVREEILGSWRRSTLAGLTPEAFEVPYVHEVDDRGRLAWAAGRILERIGSDLRGSHIGLLLTDAEGLVVSRSSTDRDTLVLFDEIRLAPGFLYGESAVGTNAIGTALREGAPTVVQAHEHFAEALGDMTCAAVTITDPATGRLIGVVDLSCRSADANTLMLPLAKQAAWEIEQRLLDDGSLRERLLQEHFLRARRTTRGPLVAINERTLLVNAAAVTVFDQTDHDRLWDCVLHVLGQGGSTGAFADAHGVTQTLHCQPVMDGPELVGAVVTVGVQRTSDGKGLGWDSLTEAELAVALQVSSGLSNREAAAHLYVSPHTIDFHLRKVFRKLDVSTRVELTRVVLAHQNGAG